MTGRLYPYNDDGHAPYGYALDEHQGRGLLARLRALLRSHRG
ncbi:MAG TPA: hypothetical protein VHU88_14940 [Sporichthyaceae bacterium]|jgi:hypothetical protein|nr:hypothetical protein [Sporichthyaceae bacterium]